MFCGKSVMRQKCCVAKVFLAKVQSEKVFAAKVPRTNYTGLGKITLTIKCVSFHV